MAAGGLRKGLTSRSPRRGGPDIEGRPRFSKNLRVKRRRTMGGWSKTGGGLGLRGEAISMDRSIEHGRKSPSVDREVSQECERLPQMH